MVFKSIYCYFLVPIYNILFTIYYSANILSVVIKYFMTQRMKRITYNRLMLLGSFGKWKVIFKVGTPLKSAKERGWHMV